MKARIKKEDVPEHLVPFVKATVSQREHANNMLDRNVRVNRKSVRGS